MTGLLNILPGLFRTESFDLDALFFGYDTLSRYQNPPTARHHLPLTRNPIASNYSSFERHGFSRLSCPFSRNRFSAHTRFFPPSPKVKLK